MKLTIKWALVLIVILFPFVLLCVAGIAWLLQHHALFDWLGLASIISLICSLAVRRLSQAAAVPAQLQINPSATWTVQGKAAWEKVESLSLQVQERDPVIDTAESWWLMLKEVMQTVAVHFNPEQTDAVWEMRIPDLLKVIELLARDLGKGFSENIPGSHILTIKDIIYGRRLAKGTKLLYNIYRLLSIGIDPISAAMRELRGAAFGNLLDSSTREVKLWLLDAYIKKIGYYAIELYSGYLVLDDLSFRQYTTPSSRQDVQKVQKREDYLTEEPLRILVVGQVKAGKSSLINALFGEMKALTDIIPTTGKIQQYLLEREGVERAIVIDTAGYEDSANPTRPLMEAKKEVLQTDLILIVCSAKSAARHADKQLLLGLKSAFMEHTREEPPVIVALSHIDHLRPFREWNPPYNIVEPNGAKASMIREAMQAVAHDLQMDISFIIPVNLKSGMEYNIEEGLVPAILEILDESRRLKYMRCLKSYKDKTYWKQLWLQSKNAGKIIVRSGVQKLA